MIVSTQQFTGPGTWFKPDGATFIDVILAGASARYPDGGSRGSGLGQIVSQRYPAAHLPREVRVDVGEFDGYAIIVTHAGIPLSDYPPSEFTAREGMSQ